MPAGTDRAPGRSRYPLWFGAAALLLVLATLLLVLVVLPRRYVLSSGFRESGVTFPVTTPPPPTGTLTQRSAGPTPEPLPREVVPRVDAAVPRGPAEVFWEEVLPLVAERRYPAALQIFEEYLARFPDDRDVRREYAVVLTRAGRGDEGVDILAELLQGWDDPELRLVLARTLRDVGRMEAASAQYALLAEQGVGGTELAIEWARSLAWVELYPEAEAVLENALDADPGNAALGIELARIHYSTGRLQEAQRILASVDPALLRRLDAWTLRQDVEAALTEPPLEESPPPTLVEQALQARMAGNLREASHLLRLAVEERPDDVQAWQAYADLLQYELSDFAAALEALREVERLRGEEAERTFRMARLALWSGDEDEARRRLDHLAARIAAEGPLPLEPMEGRSRSLGAAPVQALLGDLARWSGEPVEAAARYEAALRDDPGSAEATAGLRALRTETDTRIRIAEEPLAGALASALADTDDFRLLDLGALWTDTRHDWVWGVSAGNRWLEGLDPTGIAASRSGLFAEFEAGRWWRWGTVRTAVEAGVESVRPGETDLSLGASVRLTDVGPFSVEAAYRRGLAYPVTNTLETVFTEVVQDALRVSLSGSLTEVWSLWAESRVARLDPRGLGVGDANTRFQGALDVGRSLWSGVSLGLAASVTGFTRQSPQVGSRRLYWDPRLAAAAGPYARYQRTLSPGLSLTGRLYGGLALVDERPGDGFDRVPQVAVDLGLRLERDRFTAALEVFYQQSRFQGYRAWGARVTVGVREILDGREEDR